MRIDPDTPVKLMLRNQFKLGGSFNAGADQNTVKINDTAALNLISHGQQAHGGYSCRLPAAWKVMGGLSVGRLMLVSQVLSLKIRVLMLNILLDEAANAEKNLVVRLFIKCNLKPSLRGSIPRRIMRLRHNDSII